MKEAISSQSQDITLLSYKSRVCFPCKSVFSFCRHKYRKYTHDKKETKCCKPRVPGDVKLLFLFNEFLWDSISQRHDGSCDEELMCFLPKLWQCTWHLCCLSLGRFYSESATFDLTCQWFDGADDLRNKEINLKTKSRVRCFGQLIHRQTG